MAHFCDPSTQEDGEMESKTSLGDMRPESKNKQQKTAFVSGPLDVLSLQADRLKIP